MKCDGAREVFSDYLDGTLDEAVCVVFRGHVGRCSSCAQELNDFKETCLALDTLPEIAPSVDFRHDIVMRVARMQHESDQARRQKISIGSFMRRLIPARALTVAYVAIALMIVLQGPRMYDRIMSKAIVTPTVLSVDTSTTRTGDTSVGVDMDPSQKLDWQSRKMRRNTLWVTVSPSQDREGRMVYKVLLGINQSALLQGEMCNRLAAEVFILPSGQYGLQGKNGVTTVFQGSVLADKPSESFVVVNRSPRAETVNLLVQWRYKGRSFAYIIYMPTRYRGSFSKEMYDLSLDNSSLADNSGDLYPTLESISQDYGVIVIANQRITGKPQVVFSGQGNLDWTLRSALKPAGLDWLMADHSIYVDLKGIAGTGSIQ